MTEDQAWDDVAALWSWNPQVIDRDVMTRARAIERRHHTSWWDSTIVAAAEQQGCELLLSEDFQDGMSFGSVRVQNPFSQSVVDEAPGYAARTQNALPPRHRPRGRPRGAVTRTRR